MIDGLSFHSINFNFPSYSKCMIGDTAPPLWTVIQPNCTNHLQLITNAFVGTDGVALEYQGNGMLIQNNLFEYNDWSVALMQRPNGGLGTVMSNGINDQFIRNTLRYKGAINAFRPIGRNPVVKLNHTHHQCC